MENPKNPEEDIFLLKTNGERLAIATSGIIKRRWKKGKRNVHHIIDPRTGMPVENGIMSVTTLAPNTQDADVFAKTVLILGEEEGLEFIESRPGAECIIFPERGKPLVSKGMHKYVK